MNKILSVEQVIPVAKTLHKQGKRIVLVGGCFDILHAGHIKFLEAAKKQGDTLFILLEHDSTIAKTKGPQRPLNTQADRATLLANIATVDYVVLLPPMETNEMYDKLVIQIKPAIIATTEGDPHRHHKERQAQTISATVVDVITHMQNTSTTKFVNLLQKEKEV